MILAILGKEIRSRSRSHLGLSIIEMMCSLRNFGVLDFPLTHTGTTKNKHIRDFIKARTAIDMFRQQRCDQQMQGTMTTFTTDNPPGIENPKINYVMFGSTQKFKHHKGTLDFCEMLQTMVQLKENKAVKEQLQPKEARKQTTQFVDNFIQETSWRFTFCICDAKTCWYKQVSDPIELRSQISQIIRDLKKGINKAEKQGMDNQDAVSTMGIDTRRFEDNDSNNDYCFGRGC